MLGVSRMEFSNISIARWLIESPFYDAFIIIDLYTYIIYIIKGLLRTPKTQRDFTFLHVSCLSIMQCILSSKYLNLHAKHRHRSQWSMLG